MTFHYDGDFAPIPAPVFSASLRVMAPFDTTWIELIPLCCMPDVFFAKTSSLLKAFSTATTNARPDYVLLETENNTIQTIDVLIKIETP